MYEFLNLDVFLSIPECRSEGFSFYFGNFAGLGMETRSLDAVSATATVRNSPQSSATIGNC
jgi:hypothetical protein